MWCLAALLAPIFAFPGGIPSMVVDVAFLAIRGDNRSSIGPHVGPLVGHLRASCSLPLNVHLVTDQRRLDAPRSWRQWLVGDLPSEYQDLHRAWHLRSGSPADMYLWKPLLYRLLVDVDRLLVLDNECVYSLEASRTTTR